MAEAALMATRRRPKGVTQAEYEAAERVRAALAEPKPWREPDRYCPDCGAADCEQHWETGGCGGPRMFPKDEDD
jgi:hypothetical protein